MWLRTTDSSRAQFIRFIINGVLASAICYIVYCLLLLLVDAMEESVLRYMPMPVAANVAYGISYIVSFAFNFYFTCVFTFRRRPTSKLFVGFAGSHAINFMLHMLLFWLCMLLQVHRLLAPIIVMGVAMLVQFTVLKVVFRRK